MRAAQVVRLAIFGAVGAALWRELEMDKRLRELARDEARRLREEADRLDPREPEFEVIR